MSLTSFYGGRQGASFVIVKRFDMIEKNIEHEHKEVSYAIKYIESGDNPTFYYLYDNGFIEKNSENYKTYAWKRTELNNALVLTIAPDAEPPYTAVYHNLPDIEKESMVDRFSQGGNSTDIVNYGEYVIIDTPIKDHPDNGKVYRRGMNYQNELGGAEYIGQIVGPSGGATELILEHYDTVTEKPNYAEVSYAVDPHEDLVPGKDGNDYNDTIEYAYVTVMDEFGYITGCEVGFKIPYLVLEMTGQQRSAYYEAGDTIPEGKHEGDPLAADFELIQRLDDGEHPFYEQWKIAIPHGIKGESITLLETYEVVKGEQKTQQGIENVKTYSDQACTQDETTADTDLTIVEILSQPDAYKVELPDGTIRYTKIDNKTGLRIRHDLIDYDNNRDGDTTLIDIGKYNYISDVNVDNDGTLTVTYTYDDSDVFEKKIKWIRSVNVNENGKVTFTYNTGATETTETAIQWLTNVRINTHGEDDPENPNDGKEGDGDQKVYITYNTDGEGIEHAIGQPLNYVLDTYIVPLLWDERVLPEEAWRAYKGHLLVYYSDPTRRSDTTTGIGQYLFPSARLDTSVTGWVDLGDVKGETKTPLSIGYVDSFSDLENAGPPEEIMHNSKYAGWGVTYTSGGTEWVAQYDYLAEEWTRGIAYGSGISDPSQVIATETTNLWNNGFHVQVVSRKSVE